MPERGSATVVLHDFGQNGWVREGFTPGCVGWQSVAYTSRYSPQVRKGFTRFGALTGVLGVSALVGTPPVIGDIWEIALVQDATGGRTVTWSDDYKGVTLASSGTANQKARVRFVWDGSAFVQMASTGWYS